MSDPFPLIPPRTRLTHFTPDGCTVILLPLQPTNSVTLLHNDGVELRPFVFSVADAADLASALDAGANFEFTPGQVTLKQPDGRMRLITAIPRRGTQADHPAAAPARELIPDTAPPDKPPTA